MRLDFNAESRTWSVVNNGESYPLMTFVDDSHVKMIAPDGTMRTVEVSQAGVWAYQQVATGSFTAQK